MQTQRARVWIAAAVVAAMGWGLSGSLARATDEDAGPVQKIYEQTTPSFVLVSFHLKKSDRPFLNDSDPADPASGSVLLHILNKNAMDVIGVLLNDEGEIFTPDEQPAHREVIDHITVKGPDGVVVPARLDRLLSRAPGRILRIEGQVPAGWRPLKFAKLGEMTPETKLFVATMASDNHYHIYVRPCEYGVSWDSTADCGPRLRVPGVSSAAVLCDAEGRPVGMTCLDEIDLGPCGPAWRAEDIRSDAGVTEEQQKQLEEQIENEFARSVYEIRIMPRPEPQEDEEIAMGGRFRGRSMRQQAVQEQLFYGLAFAKDKLLIPEALDKDLVAGIDTITVQAGDETLDARFGGVLRNCAATVIELAEGTLPHHTAFPADGRVARLEPFWAVAVGELAGKDVRIECTRWVERRQGYEDQWYAMPERSLSPGGWLLDRRGRLVGFLGQSRRAGDRLESYLLGREQGRYRSYRTDYSTIRSRLGARYGYPGDTQLFEAAEMARMLSDLPAGYDRYIRRLDKDEQKRRVWLGVEYMAPDPEMIKQMDLREPTQDGRIGLLVNRVYAGSPAAALGLAEGDILLRITVPEAPWPVELVGYDRDGYGALDSEEVDIPREFASLGYQMPRRRPWPSQDNYLNRLLAEIGAGTTVKLGYLHDGQVLEKDFTIEQSPHDMLSAARYKNDQLGLTVKDMTYEARAALRLTPNEPAIIVVQVEQGTPAALARINMYELIRAVDGTPIDSVAAFEKLIAKAQKEHRESVRVTVEWMGKTRLADLKFEARAPAEFSTSLPRGRQEP